MSGSVWGLRLPLVLTGLLLAAAPITSDDATVAQAQLPVARALAKQAKVIVAVIDPVVTPVNPTEQPTRMQNFTVQGTVSECFKGPVRPPSNIKYVITAEGRPAKLAHNHIAFLRGGTNDHWVALDGPMFRDSAAMRHGLGQFLSGCHR